MVEPSPSNRKICWMLRKNFVLWRKIFRYLTNKCLHWKFLKHPPYKKMQKIPRTKIVENEEIYTFETFKDIKFDEVFCRDTFYSPESACVFLARSSLIKNKMLCSTCDSNRPMRLVKREKIAAKSIWNCTKPFSASKSIRAGSVFEHSRLCFWMIFKLISKYLKRDLSSRLLMVL
jgi:hypothetical protein